ncbi:MAG: bifunctional diguanylate cyclase/phosphodiesterase [Actinomycetota bacterium]
MREKGIAPTDARSDELTVTESVSNGVLEYFGPAALGPIVAIIFLGASTPARILTYVIAYSASTMCFPLALWLVHRRGLPGARAIDQTWYYSASVINLALPWIIAPDARWGNVALGLIFATIAGSDTVSISLRPDHRWKPMLVASTFSYSLYLLLNDSWTIAIFCVIYGVHLAGGHDAMQEVVRNLRAEQQHSDRLATTDALTGLANRRGLRRFIDESIESSAPEIVIVSVDIDNFKQINDRFGHHGGDLALRHLADYMKTNFGPEWLVARSGGDEFACATRTGAFDAAERIMASVPSFVCEGAILQLFVSVGVAIGSPDEDLLADASAALRLSKRRGKHRTTIADEELREELRESRRLSTQLAEAVQRREIEIWAQPIVHLQDNTSHRIHSYECLARWATPEGVTVPPSTFIPIIEDQRLTVELGEVIITKAMSFLALLPAGVSVAVNVSASHFVSEGFAEFMHAALAKHDLDPRRVTVEITESEDIPTDERALRVARQLAEIGVGLAIDDFGTGYASLERLMSFPCSQVKLDRSIATAELGTGMEHLLEGFGRMSAATGLAIVAEGIETPEQAQVLHQVGVPLGQGYLFGRPQPVAEVLRRHMTEDDGLFDQIVEGVSSSMESRMSTKNEPSESGRLTRSNQPTDSFL